MAQLRIRSAGLEQLRHRIPGVHEFDRLTAESRDETLPEIFAWSVGDDHGEVVRCPTAERLTHSERGHAWHHRDRMVPDAQIAAERSGRVSFERQHPARGRPAHQLTRELPDHVLGDVRCCHSSHHFRCSFLSGCSLIAVRI